MLSLTFLQFYIYVIVQSINASFTNSIFKSNEFFSMELFPWILHGVTTLNEPFKKWCQCSERSVPGATSFEYVGGHSLLFLINFLSRRKYFCSVNTWIRWCDITFSFRSTISKTKSISQFYFCSFNTWLR